MLLRSQNYLGSSNPGFCFGPGFTKEAPLTELAWTPSLPPGCWQQWALESRDGPGSADPLNPRRGRGTRAAALLTSTGDVLAPAATHFWNGPFSTFWLWHPVVKRSLKKEKSVMTCLLKTNKLSWFFMFKGHIARPERNKVLKPFFHL